MKTKYSTRNIVQEITPERNTADDSFAATATTIVIAPNRYWHCGWVQKGRQAKNICLRQFASNRDAKQDKRETGDF
jgi:hypothetical protein